MRSGEAVPVLPGGVPLEAPHLPLLPRRGRGVRGGRGAGDPPSRIALNLPSPSAASLTDPGLCNTEVRTRRTVSLLNGDKKLGAEQKEAP